MAIPTEAYDDFLQSSGSSAIENDDELEGMGDYEMGSVITQVLRYASGRLGSATLFYPFELARILRQVQHIPKGSKIASSEELGKDEADSQGYLMAGRWPLRLDPAGGLWRSCVEVAKRQGLFSLWRGLAAHGTLDLCQSLGQAAMEECCYALWPMALEKPLWVTVASSALIACLLQPLDRARTLLACQSVWPGEQRYTSMWSVLSKSNSYRHTLFDWISYLTSACLRIIPLAWTSQRVESWYQQGSLTWTLLAMLAEQAAYSLPLIITLPLETVRRRLHVQSDAHNMAHRIPIGQGYTGPWNCVRRIVREEGWCQLYQGWGWQVLQNASLLLVHTLGDRIDEADLQADDNSF